MCIDNGHGEHGFCTMKNMYGIVTSNVGKTQIDLEHKNALFCLGFLYAFRAC